MKSCCGNKFNAIKFNLSSFVVERTAICLHHNEHDEIFLYCSQGLIHILEAQHGHVVGNNASNCSYQQSDRCAVPLPNMEYLRDHCMGKGRCTVGVSPLFLDPCGRESNYMQVVYSCVSGEYIVGMVTGTYFVPWYLVEYCGMYHGVTSI